MLGPVIVFTQAHLSFVSVPLFSDAAALGFPLLFHPALVLLASVRQLLTVSAVRVCDNRIQLLYWVVGCVYKAI